MKKLILDNIYGLNLLNKKGVNNVKKQKGLSPKCEQIIGHMQHMIDILIEERKTYINNKENQGTTN